MYKHALAALLAAIAAAAGLAGCAVPEEKPLVRGNLGLTILHTADLHSRLFPYRLRVSEPDAISGLGTFGTEVRVGGAARMAWLLRQERAGAARILHLDSGDAFQGAPVFNAFHGEAELLALTAMGVDAQALGNHEFDAGAVNLRRQYLAHAGYPVLAANYAFSDADPETEPLAGVIVPWTALALDGLRVGVIGLGNLSSLSPLSSLPNELGVVPLSTLDVAQSYLDLLRPLVDLVVVVSHLGLDGDEALIDGTTGIDVVLGGHNHLVFSPPRQREDCAKSEASGSHFIETSGATGGISRRRCTPRSVLLVHSGAFGKYVGRLDLRVSNVPTELESGYDLLDGFEVIDHEYVPLPVTDDLPEDAELARLLEAYRQDLDLFAELGTLIGYAPTALARVDTLGNDSPLGNVIAGAMLDRLGVGDFSITNSSGIRADLAAGPVTADELFEILPFDNDIVVLRLAGAEIARLFQLAAERAADAQCETPLQIAGARVVLRCDGCGGGSLPACAEQINLGASATPCSSDSDCGDRPNSCQPPRIAGAPGHCLLDLLAAGSYQLLTSDFLAGGGSGWSLLETNTTAEPTSILMRDAVFDLVRGAAPCAWAATGNGLAPLACAADDDCSSLGAGFVCACSGNAAASEDGSCTTRTACSVEVGHCVLGACRQQVSRWLFSECSAPETARDAALCALIGETCSAAGEQCKYLPCLDRRIGAASDGRVRMIEEAP